jgi:hypothetical protein
MCSLQDWGGQLPLEKHCAQGKRRATCRCTCCLTPGAFDGFNKENLVNDFHFFGLQGSSRPQRSQRPQHPTGVIVITYCGKANYWFCATITWVRIWCHSIFVAQIYPPVVSSRQSITPPAVIAWLRHPVKRAHVLLVGREKRLVTRTLKCLMRRLPSELPKTPFLARASEPVVLPSHAAVRKK